MSFVSLAAMPSGQGEAPTHETSETKLEAKDQCFMIGTTIHTTPRILVLIWTAVTDCRDKGREAHIVADIVCSVQYGM